MTNRLSPMLIPAPPPPTRGASGIRWIAPALILLLALVAALGSGSAAAQSADPDPVPTIGWVSIVGPSDPVIEGETAVFTVTRGNTGQELTIPYKVSELRGGNNNPVNSQSGSVTFPSGNAEQTIQVALDDAYVEKNNRIKVELFVSPICGGHFGNPSCKANPSATAQIRDNDRYGLSIDSPSVDEGRQNATDLTFTVRLSHRTSFPVEVDYTVGGTATAGPNYTDADYRDQLTIDGADAPLVGAFTFPPGETQKRITVTVNGDAEIEEDETVVVEVELADEDDKALAYPNGREASVAGVIRNDDEPIDGISIAGPSQPVTEGETAEFTVTRDNTRGSRQLTYSVCAIRGASDNPTPSGADCYDYDNSGNVSFTPGEGVKTIRFRTSDDDHVEQYDRVRVTLHTPGTSLLATARVQDNDRYTLHVESPGVDEGNSGAADLTFNVDLDKPADFPVEVDYRVIDSGTADADDYYDNQHRGTVAFEPGETEKQVTVKINGDAKIEEDETVAVEVELADDDDRAYAAAGGDAASGVGVIRNDDYHVISVQNDGPDILTEPDSGATANLSFVVNLSEAAPGPVMVDYRTIDGTAISGGAASAGEDDYESASGTLTFEAGAVSKTIDVTVNGDDAFEGETPENLWLLLSNPRGPSEIDVGFELDNLGFERRSFLGLIADNPPHLKLTVDAPTVLESDEGGTPLLPFFFTLRMNQPQEEEVTVEVARTGGSATYYVPGNQHTDNADYTNTPLQSVTFKPGETEKEARFYILPDNRVEPDETVEITVTAPPIFNPSGDDDVVIVATGAILNNDHRVWVNSPKVTEGDAGETTLMTFTVTLNPPVSSGEVTIDYQTADSTSGRHAHQIDADWIGSNDYEAKSGALTFPANTGSQQIHVTVNGDDFDESDERLKVELSGLSGPEGIRLEFPPGHTGKWSGKILDDDDFTYTVPLEANTQSVPEGAWRMLVDGRRRYQTFVRLELRTNRQWYGYGPRETCNAGDGGTAVGAENNLDRGDYYQDLPSTFINHVHSRGDYGESGDGNNLWCLIPIWGDPFIEDDETVVVTYQNSEVDHGDPITLGAITILNDDHRLSVDSPSVDEGDTGTADLVFTVTLDPPSLGTVTVDYATVDGTAKAGGSANTGGDDYEPKSGVLTFEAGETEKTVTVLVNGDETYEGERLTQDEKVHLELSNPSGPGFSTIKLPGEPAVALQPSDPAYVPPQPSELPSGKILHDDPFPKVSIGAPTAPVVEGGDLVFPVTLSNAYYEATWRVRYQLLADSSATRGEDYTAEGYDENNWGIVELAPGQTKASITLKTTDDTAVEDAETVRVRLTKLPEAIYEVDTSKNTATGTITDNDGPVVTVASDGDVTEGENAEFTLTRTRDASSQLTVNLAVTDPGSALSGDAPTTATIPANATTATVSLATEDDNTDAPNATLTLTLANGDAYDLGATHEATLTVRDNDGTPELTVADASAAEDADLTFVLSLSPASSGTVKVDYAITPDTAQASDYTGTTSGTVTFAPGDTSKDVTLDLVDDTLDEPDETVTLTLSDLNGTASIADGAATGTIADNDLPLVTASSGGDVTEGSDAEFTLTRASEDTGAALEVTFSVTGGGSALSDDPPTSATIPANATTATVSLATEDDNTDEPDATLTLTLADGDAYDLGGDSAATLTVADNDDTPELTVADAEASEDADLVFELTLDPASSGTVEVDYAITADTAQAADYTGTTSGTVTFAPGETSKDVTLDLVDDTLDELDETVTLTLSGLNGTASVADGVATGTITDDDPPQVTVASGGDITEGESAEFILTRASEDTGAALLVAFAVTGGDTALSDDPPVSATIPANATTVTVSLPTEDDATEESDATLTLTLTDGDDYDLGDDSAATLTVQDNDTPEAADTVVSVKSVKSTITEGDDATFALTRAGESSGELTVTFTVTDSGSVLSGAAPTSVAFEDGQTTAPVILATDDDDTVEENATLSLTLTGGSGYNLSRNTASASVTVKDNDASNDAEATLPKVTVAAVDATVTEGSDAVFRLTRTGDATAVLTVTFSVTGGESALSGEAPTSATIPANATTALVTLATEDDEADEPDATLTLTLTDGDAYDLGADSAATLTVQDNDDTPELTVADASASEDADLTFTLSLSPVSNGPVTVDYAITPDTAQAADYAGTTSGTITFAPGETSKDVALDLVDDTLDEPDETVTLTLSDLTGPAILGNATATGTIADNDLPVVTVASDGDVTEGADAEFILTRASEDTGAALTVTFSVTGGGSALSDDPPTTATIPANATTVTVTLATEDDNTDEPNATLTLTLADGAAYDLGSDSAATLIVRDNDGTPALSAADAEASEDADLVFELTLDPASSQEVTVDYEITADTAQAADYAGTTSGTVTFAPGETSKDVALDLVDDTADEPDETVTLTLSGLIGTASIADGAATGTIADNDLPVVTVASDGDVTEGADAEFTLTRASEDTGAALTVTFSVTGGDAALSDDPPTSATIPANATTVAVSLATEDDETDEPDATLTLTLADGAAYDLGGDSVATLSVADNDDTPELTVADAEASEDADLVFEITLDPASSGTVTVDYEITADTAQAADYTGTTSGTVTFAPGETSKDVALDLVDDTADEPDETVTLTLSNLTGQASLGNATATGTIADNDLPLVTAASGGDVTEGADAEFTLTRASEDTGAALTVTFSVTGGDAALSGDAPTSATIPANATTATVSLATEDDETDEPDATLTLTLADGAAYDLGGDRAATLTVRDNDDTPELTVADASASEDADLVFELTLNPASSQEVTVDYEITADTAQAADYTGTTSGTVTFAPGETSKDVALDLVDDMLDEPDETVTLTLSGVVGTASIADGAATGTIVDNDLPLVTAASGGDVTEGSDAEFTLTRASEDTGAALTVTFSVTGGGSALSDDPPTSATIPANATTATVSLATEDDNTDEPDATLTLTLTDGAAYDLGGDSAATLTVQDNDDTPTLTVADAEASEDADLVFELTLDPSSSQEVTVDYAITADTAQTADYTGATSGTVTFAPGETSKDVALDLVDDTLDEPDETVTLTLSGVVGTASVADATATGTITDNDLPVLTVASDGDVTEGADAEFTLTRASEDTGAALTVTFSVTGGDAVLSDDAPTSATIPANATTVAVSLGTEDDNTDEPDATLTLTLTDGAAYDLGSDSAATLTVEDNDGAPELSAADAEASEDADLVFELTLDPASSQEVTVDYAITADTAQSGDYTGTTSGTVTFAPGETSKDVTLDLVDDTLDEPDETVTLTLSGLNGTASVADGAATGTIVDNDLPLVTAASGGDVTEGENAEFTLTRASEDTGAALEVTFSVTGGGSALSDDPPTSATIPANATTATVSLATEDDNTDEPNATLTLTLADGAAYDLGAPSAATLTVADNDGTPELTVADASASEDADLTFVLSLSPASSGTVTVDYAITPDTAQAADYTGTTSGTVTFAPGETSKDVALDLVDDTADEPDETVTLTLSGVVGTASIADGAATGTIADNDLPLVTAASGGDVTEGSDAEFTLTRASEDTGAALEVTFSVTGGGSALSDDPPTTATIPANATTVTVSLATEDDETDEPDATLTLTLADGAAYDLGGDSVATLSVADNDDTPELTVADAEASEDADLVFEITLDPASSGTVTVDYEITADTAQAADYTGTTSGTVTFAPGETSKDVALDLVDDTADEPDETVTLTLSNLTGQASLGNATATGTIADNDLPLVTAASGGDVTEGADAEFTLTRASEDTGAELTVTFSVTGGDAALSGDAPTSATIPANATTVTVSLATEDDETDEPDATLTLTLADGAAYDLGGDRAATLTVRDNDDTPELTVADASASEDADLVFELTLNPASSQEVTVDYEITADTAQAADYTGTTSGTVTFAPGETSKDVALDLVDDMLDEPDETVTLTLSGVVGTASIADGAATGTIVDNDLPLVTAASGGDVTEGSDAEFTLTRASEDTGAALTVTFSVTGGGSALSDDPPTSATIPANATTVTVSLATEDDNTDEPNATLTLTLADGDAYDLGGDRAATLTVRDNDDTPALSVADAEASEDADLVFELTLDPASSQEVTVDYEITPDTAQAADYTGATSGTVTFAPGETSKDVALYLVDDTADEPDETVTLTLSNLTGQASLGNATATGTIADNDLPLVTAASGGDVTEGADAEFTLTRASEDTGAALTVTFSVTGGDAALSGDAPTSATIPANATTVTVSLATEDDETDEPDATLTLTLADGAAYDLGTPSAATLTVADNDGTPALTVADASASEDADLVFELTLNPASSQEVTVDYEITADTAQAADYTGTTSGTVTFAPGETSKDVALDLVDDATDEPDETVTLTLSGLTGQASLGNATATGTIADNDLPLVTAASGGDVTEGADAEFTLTRASEDTGAALTVTFSVTGGDAALSGDAPTSATIPANATTVTVSLATEDDETDEPDATLTLTLADGAAYDLGTPSAATLTVADNDDNALPYVTIVSATEMENGEVVFTLRRTGNLSVPLVIRYKDVYRGQGVSLREGYWTFAEGSSTLEKRDLEFVEGIVTEADRTVELTLLPPNDHASGYVVGEPSEATLRVAGTPRPTLSVADAAASEDTNMVFALTMNPASELSVTVSYAITPDTAQAEDYTGTTSGTVTFAPGDTSKKVTLSVVDDSIAEPDETVTLMLTLPDQHEDDRLNPGFYRVGTARIADATATGTITDNDLPLVTAASGGDVTEGADAEFTLTRDGEDTGAALTVTFSVTGGDAALSGDPPTSATIPANATTVTVSLATEDDETDEPDATLTLTLTDGDDYDLGADSAATLTVQDNDDTINDELPVVTVTSGGNVTEGESAEFTLTRDGEDTGAALTVTFSVTGGGSALSDGPPTSATIPSNATTVTVSLATEDDNTDEPNATLTLTLADGDDYDLGADSAATLTVQDNDDTPELTVADASASEDADLVFEITLDPASSGTVKVDYAITPDTAQAADYTGTTSGTVTFAPGETSKDVALDLVDDSADEPDETVTLALSGVAGTASVADGAATGTIADNDLPVVTAASGGDVTEGADAEFTLTRASEDIDEALLVAFAVTGGDTALSDDPPVSATIPANETTVTVSLATEDDETDEPDATLTLTLTDGDDYDLGADSAATLTVQDNDDTPELTVADASASEDADLVFELTLNPASSQEVTVDYEITADTAQAADYTGTTSGTVTFAPGETSKDVALDLVDDATDEPDETVTLTLSGLTGQASLGNATATGTIADNDLPLVTAASGGDVTEGADAEFTLTRASEDTGAALTVNFSVTGGGSALSNDAPTSATIPANATTATVSLATEDDETDEPDATLTLTLTDGDDYDLGADSAATLTVQDNDDTINDELPVVTVTSGGNVTEGESAEFTLTRGGEDTGAALTVTFSVTGGGSALSDDPPTSATIPANATTATVSLATEDDNTDEPNATLTLTLADGDDYDLGSDSAATLTVADNDDTPALSAADAEASEDADLVFVLTLNPASSQEVTVDYEITPDTAQTADYTGSTSGALTFAPGETSKDVTLDLVDDEAAELDETVTLNLANLTGPASIADGTATGVITDNDQQVVTVESATETENGEVVFTLRRTGNLSIALTIGYQTVYRGQGVNLREGYRTFAVGSSTLEMRDPEFVEGIVTEADRTVELTLLPPDDHASGYVVGEPSEATLRVAGTPRPTLSVADAAASESADLVFALTMSPASELSVAVDYAITPGTAQDADYTGTTSGTVTFAPGDTSKKVTLSVVDDDIAEPDETVTLTLTLPDQHEDDRLNTGFYRVGTARIADATATGTITDNDLPVVAVAAEAGAVTEGEDAVFVFSRTGDASAPLTLTVAVGETGSVLAVAPPTAAVFGANETETRLRVATVDDSTEEPDGRVTVTVRLGDGYTVAPGAGSAGVDVLDDDGSSSKGQADGEASDDGSSSKGQADGEASDDGSGSKGQADGEASDDGSSSKGQADGEASDDGSSSEGQADGEASDDGSGSKGQADGEASDDGSSSKGQADGEASDDGSSSKGQDDGEASDDDAPSPAALTATKKPGTVRHLSVSVGSGGRLTISWKAPDAGGAASGYDVDYDLAGSAGGWVTALDGGEATSVTVTGLAPGKYRIRVRATNPYGASRWVRDRGTVVG